VLRKGTRTPICRDFRRIATPDRWLPIERRPSRLRFFPMNDRAVIRSFETGQGKRLAILVVAIAVLALVLGFVVIGFRDRHIPRSTDALMRSQTTTHTARPFPSR
jgi:hypothetical protein